MLPLNVLHLGPLRLTPYGACASLGVLLAMALSGRAARRAGLAAEAAWDAGLFAVISCFVASRILLVLSDLQAFLRYPALLLGLPSLTISGMVLAGVAIWLYLRRRQLSVLRTLDLYAPCGAVLAMFLEAGHWLDGSEPGMPVFAAAKDKALRFVPVSLYGMLVAAVLAGALWAMLGRNRSPGKVAALGLMLGGVAAFGLDMASLPLEIGSTFPLEPGQVVALAAVLAGALVWTFAPKARAATV